MSNGKAGGDIWRAVVGVLAILGITGASWVTLNSAVAAQGRDVANACERVARVEERLTTGERDMSEVKGDLKEIKAILKRIEDSQRNRGRASEP